MPKRKRSQEKKRSELRGTTLTAHRKQQRESKTLYCCHESEVPELQLTSVRTQCMIEARQGPMDHRTHMVYKRFLKGCDMETIVQVESGAAIAAGLLEAMRQGMSLEADAQVVLCSASEAIRPVVAKAFLAEASELGLSCDERKERLASLLESLARRMTPRSKAEVKRFKRKPTPKAEPLEAQLDRHLALSDTKAAAKVLAEARLVDDDVQDQLTRLKENNPLLARDLAINLLRRARRAKGGKAKFLKALARRTEPEGTSQLSNRKPEKSQAA